MQHVGVSAALSFLIISTCLDLDLVLLTPIVHLDLEVADDTDSIGQIAKLFRCISKDSKKFNINYTRLLHTTKSLENISVAIEIKYEMTDMFSGYF